MWTNAEQTDFLYAKIELYFTYQREGRLIHFWPLVYREWVERWGDGTTKGKRRRSDYTIRLLT